MKQKSFEETEDELQPVLDEEKGYYLIGKREKATDIFCLSVTIAAAKNLTKVQKHFLFLVFFVNNFVIHNI